VLKVFLQGTSKASDEPVARDRLKGFCKSYVVPCMRHIEERLSARRGDTKPTTVYRDLIDQTVLPQERKFSSVLAREVLVGI